MFLLYIMASSYRRLLLAFASYDQVAEFSPCHSAYSSYPRAHQLDLDVPTLCERISDNSTRYHYHYHHHHRLCYQAHLFSDTRAPSTLLGCEHNTQTVDTTIRQTHITPESLGMSFMTNFRTAEDFQTFMRDQSKR